MNIKLLDRGYLNLVESWGSDERIIEAARMSTNKGFKGWGRWECSCGIGGVIGEVPGGTCCQCDEELRQIPGDEKLLRFLWEHKHYTPFEMAGLVVEIQAPIMVFREWHRHRTLSYNELSARYTELPNLYYLPDLERLKNGKQSKTNKQGSAEGFSEEEAVDLQKGLALFYSKSRQVYEELLQRGVARELARLVIPVSQYSRMRASGNLRNWLAFLTLRMDEAAQWEIRQYANVLADIVKEKFPRTYELFKEGNS